MGGEEVPLPVDTTGEEEVSNEQQQEEEQPQKHDSHSSTTLKKQSLKSLPFSTNPPSPAIYANQWYHSLYDILVGWFVVCSGCSAVLPSRLPSVQRNEKGNEQPPRGRRQSTNRTHPSSM